ncbi:MAG: endo alpha-1,4 polygalactosaminidase [Magnetococcales bacterium]|nr:endo alpha-1,4 polygalactosaminidase [Magnetococcales bacterium]
MPIRRFLVLFLLTLLLPVLPARGGPPIPWAALYSDQVTLTALEPYELLVLEPRQHPPLRPLIERGKRLLAYLSLGEMARDHPDFPSLQTQGFLLEENPDWPGSFMVDVRDLRWTRKVIEELIPNLLQAGFHGLFLDTLDNPPFLEERDPERFHGMTRAAANLVLTIRLHYPDIPLMINRAYALLPEVGGALTMVLGESVRSAWHGASGEYRRVTAEESRQQVAQLREALRRHPHLQVFTLDYWSPTDRAGIATLYREQRALGFHPYVSTRELDQLVPEPKP